MNFQYSLESVEMTLRKLNWTQIQGMNPQLELWVPSETSGVVTENISDEPAVFVPIDTSAPDFDRLLERAVQQLSTFSTESVFEELELSDLRLSKQLDEFQLHVEGPEAVDGIVRWQQGVDLINGARDILIAGAKTTQVNRRRFSGAEATIAKSFLDSCYMGQTKIGSYIVSALIPTTKELATSKSRNKKSNVKVKGRDVTETIIASLEASREVLEEFSDSGNDDVFEWGMTQGVSVEILRGIKNVIGEGETEISVDFSMLDGEARIPSKVINFTPKLKAAAASGEEVLSRAPKPKTIMVSGEVTGLARKFDEPDSARIKLRGLVGNKMRTFTARLDQEAYQKALTAHDNEQMLMLVGTADGGIFTHIENVVVTNAKVGMEKQHEKSEGSVAETQEIKFE